MVQRLLHALVGGDKKEEEEKKKPVTSGPVRRAAKAIILTLHSGLAVASPQERPRDLCALGFALHLYADTFSHEILGSRDHAIYETKWGHARDGHFPDYILYEPDDSFPSDDDCWTQCRAPDLADEIDGTSRRLLWRAYAGSLARILLGEPREQLCEVLCREYPQPEQGPSGKPAAWYERIKDFLGLYAYDRTARKDDPPRVREVVLEKLKKEAAIPIQIPILFEVEDYRPHDHSEWHADYNLFVGVNTPGEIRAWQSAVWQRFKSVAAEGYCTYGVSGAETVYVDPFTPGIIDTTPVTCQTATPSFSPSMTPTRTKSLEPTRTTTLPTPIKTPDTISPTWTPTTGPTRVVTIGTAPPTRTRTVSPTSPTPSVIFTVSPTPQPPTCSGETLFLTGNADIEYGPTHGREVQSFADCLKSLDPTPDNLLVIGHADDRDSKCKNLKLACQRACAVARQLSPLVVNSYSCGEYRPGQDLHQKCGNPIIQGCEQAWWQDNRRVEFRSNGVAPECPCQRVDCMRCGDLCTETRLPTCPPP